MTARATHPSTDTHGARGRHRTPRTRVRRAAARVGLSLVMVLASLAAPAGQAPPPYRDASLPVAQRVADLLARMTLEEKVAQTMAIWQQKRQIVNEAGEFDPAKAAGVLQHGIGEVTRPSDGQERGGQRRSPRETVEFVNAIQRWVVENTRLGIPVMFHEEALHGLAAKGGTHFPVPVGLASTWDEALIERVFTVAARETRARGSQQVLSPVLDLAWDPRWGRVEETYGEDPHLVARLGLAAIRGYQGPMPVLTPGRVFAAMKHYAAHGPNEGGINTAPTSISERLLREELLWPFEVAVREAPVMGVMPSYNEVDGVPSHASRFLLRQVLRQEWGFDGVVVSDYNAIEQLAGRHQVAGSLAEAGRLALEAGVDLELPDRAAYVTLVEDVEAGRVSLAALDRAVAAILRLKFLAGLFEHPYADPDEAERVTNSPEHQAVALEAARKSLVLLKNDSATLPLDRGRIRTLAVVGPNAADVHLGGYSEDPGRGVSVLDGIRAAAGSGIRVVHAEGVRITEEPPSWYRDDVTLADPAKNRARIAEAVKAARGADVIVAVVGTNVSIVREAYSDTHLGDGTEIGLIAQQDELVSALVETGRPVVLVLVNGRPLSIPETAEKVPAILETWYAGQEGGTAIAEALFGDVNPGGKLPVSVARSVGQLPIRYNRKPTSFRNYVLETRAPLFPFGHGLSYTTFELGDLTRADAEIGPNGRTVARVRVTNTGSRAGDEVVQLYVHDKVASVTR
ncbi:MAG TPA: glycoside hydrolase family 3 N-terminal domain-containing protein, partial [Methylomirabilota bacterium]